MNTVNLNISLPADLYNTYILQDFELNINDYIVETIKQKLKTRTQSFDEILIEGYLASNSDNGQIISDFSSSDFEHWD